MYYANGYYVIDDTPKLIYTEHGCLSWIIVSMDKIQLNIKVLLKRTESTETEPNKK